MSAQKICKSLWRLANMRVKWERDTTWSDENNRSFT